MTEDFVPINARDFIVDGPTYDLREELLAWGCVRNSVEQRWELHGTDSNCQDFQQLKLLGLKLYPIQCTSSEKFIRDSLMRQRR